VLLLRHSGRRINSIADLRVELELRRTALLLCCEGPWADMRPAPRALETRREDSNRQTHTGLDKPVVTSAQREKFTARPSVSGAECANAQAQVQLHWVLGLGPGLSLGLFRALRRMAHGCGASLFLSQASPKSS
jgi:hypothetical protein